MAAKPPSKPMSLTDSSKQSVIEESISDSEHLRLGDSIPVL